MPIHWHPHVVSHLHSTHPLPPSALLLPLPSFPTSPSSSPTDMLALTCVHVYVLCVVYVCVHVCVHVCGVLCVWCVMCVVYVCVCACLWCMYVCVHVCGVLCVCCVWCIMCVVYVCMCLVCVVCVGCLVCYHTHIFRSVHFHMEVPRILLIRDSTDPRYWLLHQSLGLLERRGRERKGEEQ